MTSPLPSISPLTRSGSFEGRPKPTLERRRVSVTRETFAATPTSPGPNRLRPFALSLGRTLSRAQLRQLGRAFVTADVDFHRHLAADQLRLLLVAGGLRPSQVDVELLMAHLDTDQDGRVTLEDFSRPTFSEVLRHAAHVVPWQVPSAVCQLGEVAPAAAKAAAVGRPRRASLGPRATSPDAARPALLSPSRSLELGPPRPTTPPSDSRESELRAFFHGLHIHEAAAINVLKETCTSVDQLVECSYNKHDLSFLLGEAGFSSEARRRLAHQLELRRNDCALASRKVAIVVDVSHYHDARVQSPAHVEGDGEGVVDAFLRMGYAVHRLHTDAPGPKGLPYLDNVVLLLRAVSSMLQYTVPKRRGEMLAATKVVVYLLGNGVLVEDPAAATTGWCLMTQEWDFDAPRDALLPLATLAAAFPGGIVPVVVADFAATYHIPDPASHHFPLLGDTPGPAYLTAVSKAETGLPHWLTQSAANGPLPPLTSPKVTAQRRGLVLLERTAAVLLHHGRLQLFDQPPGGGQCTDAVLAAFSVSGREVTTRSLAEGLCHALRPWAGAGHAASPTKGAPSDPKALSVTQLSEAGIEDPASAVTLALGCLLPVASEGAHSVPMSLARLFAEASARQVKPSPKKTKPLPIPSADGSDMDSTVATEPEPVGGAPSFRRLLERFPKVIASRFAEAGEADPAFWEATRAALGSVNAAVQGDGPDVLVRTITPTRCLAVCLHGDLRQSIASGAIDGLQAEVDALVGCPNTRFELRMLGNVKEHWNRFLQAQHAERQGERFRGPGGGGGARQRRVEDVPEPELLAHDPALLLIALPLPMARALQSQLRFKKRRSSRIGLDVLSLDPLDPSELQDMEVQFKDVMDKWDQQKQQIAQAIQSRKQLRIIGLRPSDVFSHHVVTVQCTPGQARALTRRLKEGALWLERVVEARRPRFAPGDPARPGVLSAVGYGLMASLRHTLALQSHVAVQRQCRLPHRTFKPVLPVTGARVDVRRRSAAGYESPEAATARPDPSNHDAGDPRVKRAAFGSSLQAAVQRCVPGDTLEVEAGVWVGTLVLDKSFVTLVALGEVVLSCSLDAPAVIIQASCRLQGLHITSKGLNHPALLIEQGDPEILDCVVSGQHGCVKAQPRTAMLMRGCVLQGTISLAAALVMDNAGGQLVNCQITNSITGVNIIGAASQPYIQDCTISHNKGAGVVVEQQARLRLSRTEVAGNTCPGVLVEQGGHVLIYRCVIHHNKGGGVSVTSSGAADIHATEFRGNEEAELAVRGSVHPVNVCRNQFFRDARSWKASDVAISMADATLFIEDNDFDGYHHTVLSRGHVSKSVVQLNRAVGNARDDSVFVKHTGGLGEPLEKHNVRYNDWYPAAASAAAAATDLDASQLPPDEDADAGEVQGEWSSECAGLKDVAAVNRSLPLTGLSLWDCVAHGNYACFRHLVGTGTALNRWAIGRPLPLLMSVRQGNESMTRLLLQTKANPNQLGEEGWGALHVVVHAHHEELMKLLLKHLAWPTLPTADGATPASVALESGNPAALRGLLDTGAVDVNALVGGGHMPGKQSLVLKATLRRDMEALQLLADARADLNLPEEGTGMTPLHAAVQHRARDVAEWLLERRAHPNLVMREGDRPLFQAVRAGDVALTQLLLAAQADVEAVTANRSTAAHIAAEADVADVLEVLLGQAPELLGTINARGETPLHRAVCMNAVRCCNALLARNASVSVPDKTRRCAGLYARAELLPSLQPQLVELAALCREQEDAAELQREAGRFLPLLTGPNALGVPPLLLAVVFGNKRGVQFFLGSGALPAWRDGLSVAVWPHVTQNEAMVAVLTKLQCLPTPRDLEALQQVEKACNTEEKAQIVRLPVAPLVALSKEAARRQHLLLPHSCIPALHLPLLAQRMAAAMECLRSLRDDGASVEDDVDDTIGPRDDLGATILSYLAWLPGKLKGAVDKYDVETWIWNARWFTINKVIDGSPLPIPSLFKLALYAMDTPLYAWTTRAERLLPVSSAEGPAPASRPSVWSPLPDLLLSALPDLPPYEGVCYVYSAAYDEPLTPRAEVAFPVTLWATADVAVARGIVVAAGGEGEGGTLLAVTSVTGRRLTGHGVHECNQEVLFPRGTVFKVMAVSEAPSTKWLEWRAVLAAAAGEPGHLPARVVELRESPAPAVRAGPSPGPERRNSTAGQLGRRPRRPSVA
eukprot:EG_transcript_71